MVIKLEAASRLLASHDREGLLAFLKNLKPDELKYFYSEFPKTLQAFVFGDLMVADSDHLEITFAASYHRIDAAMVALGHVKRFYPPANGKPLYRSLLIDIDEPVPDKPIIDITTKGYKPVQSWTYLKTPILIDREIPEDQYNLILSLDAAQAKPYVVTDYSALGWLCNDSIWLLRKELKEPVHYWEEFYRELEGHEAEQEVILYVPETKTLHCKWRVAENDPR